MPGGWLVRELKGGAIYYDPVSFNLLFDLEHE
jgi:hypothetical protein